MSAARPVAAALPTLLLVLATPQAAHAYIGPGAGFAFVTSFFTLLLAFLLAAAAILAWPFTRLLALMRRRKRTGRASARRVVVLGLDGLDPGLAAKFMDQGLLPNFSRVRRTGCFANLATTVPAVSPVAWSSFMTGCNPGKHNIFDFLVPDFRALVPRLSSARVRTPRRAFSVGPWRIPLGRPLVTGGRRSVPFWKILGDHGVPCSVLRVPMTFPPEKYRGLLLSAMGVPDLRGSQGTYSYYTTDPEEERTLTGGVLLRLVRAGNSARGSIEGPENTLRRNGGGMSVPFTVSAPSGGSTPVLRIGRGQYPLAEKEYTPWVRVIFRPGLGVKVSGICRFMLLESSPHVRLYMTPLQIDPERPALPISYPGAYAVYLAKYHGRFATLGLPEDTWALNEGIIDEEAFLEQCRAIHRERETMFFDALDKTPSGLVVCVFDLADRVQHMFLRDLEEAGPGGRGAVIREAYRLMDELLGRVLDRIDGRTALLVVSDHGFKAFHRGINLNSWLREQGYLAVLEDRAEEDMLGAIDWERTRAYSVGFGGIYLNLRGRESRGVVAPGTEADRLRREIGAALGDLLDGEVPVVREVFDTRILYNGPYLEGAPDLVAGFAAGYRAAWSAVTGGVGERIFEENSRPWGGDHSMHPAEVPGIFLANRTMARKDLRIEDVAPTILELFGVPVPAHMDGRAAALAGGIPAGEAAAP